MTETTKANELEKIFLNYSRIADWERPLSPGDVSGAVKLDAYTKIIKPLTMNHIVAETTENYMIYGSAMKYLAEVTLWNGDLVFPDIENSWKDLVTGNPEKMILFSGGIQIYERGIPGVTNRTDLSSGFTLRRNGRIWYAQKPKDTGENNLGNVLFGTSKTDLEREKRIEAILRGYEEQELEAERNQHNLHYKSYMKGRFDLTAV